MVRCFAILSIYMDIFPHPAAKGSVAEHITLLSPSTFTTA